MKCVECGGTLTVKRETVRFSESGLPNVVISNLEVRRCPKCGEEYRVIPRMEQLLAALAKAVARKHSRLTPQEVRFLRKYLGWDNVEFAKHMGVTPESVSRWQSAENPVHIGTTADRLLRVMVFTTQPKQDYTLDMLKEVARSAAKSERIDVRERNHEWEAVPA